VAGPDLERPARYFFSSFFSSADGVAGALGAVDGVALEDGAALDEDDESLVDGVVPDGPVELAGGVALEELLDDGAVLAGGVAVEEEDEDGVALVLALLPSSLPHAESARATAAANSSEVLFIFYTFLRSVEDGMQG